MELPFFPCSSDLNTYYDYRKPRQPFLYCPLFASRWQYWCCGYPHCIPLLWQQAHSSALDKSNQHGHPVDVFVYFLAHPGMGVPACTSACFHLPDNRTILTKTNKMVVSRSIICNIIKSKLMYHISICREPFNSCCWMILF